LNGLTLLALLVWVELRAAQPMLELRLFADRMFRRSNLVYFTYIASAFGLLFLFPLQLQEARGLSALESGLTTFPQALGIVLIGRFAAKLYPRIGPRRMLVASMAGIAVMTTYFLLVDLESSLWWIRGAMFVRGLFAGLAIVPVQAAAFSTITPRMTGRASALFSTNRQVAMAVSVALTATILTSRTKSHLAAATGDGALLGFHEAYAAVAIIALVGFALAFLVRDADAAATFVRLPARSESKGESEADVLAA
jgi:MFS family permease